jgi:hypothetical protein
VTGPAIEVVRGRRGYEATITIGSFTLAARRPTEHEARQAVLDLYEDQTFGCDRQPARNLRRGVRR